MVRPLRGGHPLSGVLSLALLLGPALLPPSAKALELDGRTYFRRPPWSVDLISYYTTVWEPWAEYYFTLSLDPQAGASLGGLEITQTRGVDRRFPFDVGRTKAARRYPWKPALMRRLAALCCASRSRSRPAAL
mgnify:CR=1 FL=1